MKEEVVYVILKGEYSDTGIEAIFTNEKEFEAYCAVHADEFNLEWGSLHACCVPITHCESTQNLQNVVYYYFEFNYNDGILELNWTYPRIAKRGEEFTNTITKRPVMDYSVKPIARTDKSWYAINIYLRENNPEKALKIASDMVAAERAKEEGLI